MTPFDLAGNIIDNKNYDNAVRHLGQGNVVLPTFSELANPSIMDQFGHQPEIIVVAASQFLEV